MWNVFQHLDKGRAGQGVEWPGMARKGLEYVEKRKITSYALRRGLLEPPLPSRTLGPEDRAAFLAAEPSDL